MKKDRHDYFSLALWILLLLFISAALGGTMQKGLDTWYKDLVKSPLTPPGLVFGIVWTILYILLGISGWLLWDRKKHKGLTSLKILFIAQLILNWLWTPIFFRFHMLTLSFIWILAISILAGIIIELSSKKIPAVAWLFSPYVLWLIFCQLFKWIYSIPQLTYLYSLAP